MEFQKFLCLFLACFSCLLCSSQAYKFYVGGKDGWVEDPHESYNHWAERNRFQVNDTLFFKYKKGSDSVLMVKKDDYYNCNTKQPLKKMEDGESEFMFDRSGPFYFISGKRDHCQKGQRLIVIVLHVRTLPPPAVNVPPSYAPPHFPPPPYQPPVAPSPKSPSPVMPPKSMPPSTTPSPRMSPSQSPEASAPKASSPSPATVPSPAASSPVPVTSPVPSPPQTSSPAPATSPYNANPPASTPSLSPKAPKSPVQSPGPSRSTMPPPGTTPSGSTPSPSSSQTGTPANELAPTTASSKAYAIVTSWSLMVVAVSVISSVVLGSFVN